MNCIFSQAMLSVSVFVLDVSVSFKLAFENVDFGMSSKAAMAERV